MKPSTLYYLNPYKKKTSPCFNEEKMWTYNEVPGLYKDGVNVNVYKDRELGQKYYCLFDDEIPKAIKTQQALKNIPKNVKYQGTISGLEDCNKLYQSYKDDCKLVDSTFSLSEGKIVPIIKATTRNFFNYPDYSQNSSDVTLQDILDIFYITLRSNPGQIQECAEGRDYFKNVCLYKKNFKLDLNHEYNISLYRFISSLNLLGQDNKMDSILTFTDLKNLEKFKEGGKFLRFEDIIDFWNLINLVSRINRNKLNKKVEKDLLIDLLYSGYKSDPDFNDKWGYLQLLFPNEWEDLRDRLDERIEIDEREFSRQFGKGLKKYNPKVLQTPQKKKKIIGYTSRD